MYRDNHEKAKVQCWCDICTCDDMFNNIWSHIYDLCLVLTGRKWNVYSVSLLYNLQAMIDSLGSYSRSLTAHVKVGIEGGAAAYSLDGNEGEDVENEGKLTVTKATITIMKDLKSYVTDHPAIRITMNGRKAAGD